MKYFALLGGVSAITLSSKTNQDKLFDNMNVQLEESKVLEMHDNWNGWHAHMNEFPGTVNENGNFLAPYARSIPERFVGDSAETDYYPVDTFTQNILNKYAIEGVDGKKEKNPQPTGAFYLTKVTARKASEEVLCTHFKKCGAEGKKYLDFYYEDAWNYYDVNRVQRIDAIGVSQFFRFLTRPLGDIDLQ
jgi:hypothetical protein